MTWFAAPASRPVVIGHRGDAAHAPENTLAAFRAAISAGARAVETDVQVTADGVPILLHDGTPDRTTDAAAHAACAGTPAEALTWDALASLDAGAWFDERFRGEPVARLADLGELLAEHPGVGLDLEIKPPVAHAAATVVDAVATELARPPWADLLARGEVLVTSFDPEVVLLALERLPVPVGLLTAATPAPQDMADLALSGVVALMTQQDDVTSDAVSAAHEAGLAVGVYTANEPDWARVMAAGVDAVCTDDPAGLADHLTR